MGEVKQVSCSDKGRAVTDCDALAGFNDAFRKALAAHATCLPDGTVGTIEFMADVNFQKKRIGVIAPDDGRTVKKKVAAACAIQIKRSLVEGFPLADVKHDHTKYRHSVVATFGKPVAAAQ